MTKQQEIERRLFLYHQCFDLLRAENKKLKEELILLSSSS
jgi:hypothetical protein